MNLISPYTPKSNVYKGSIHFHTTGSDGTLTPSEAMTWYRDKGYDFASISDHDVATSDPEVSEILFILGEEYSNPEYKRQHDIWTNVGETQWEALAHPRQTNTGEPTMAQLEQYILNYESVAVWNTLEDDNYEDIVDYFLSLGYQFNLHSEDDSHAYGAEIGSAGIYVYADSLTVNDVMTNLHAGNYYSFKGGVISDLTISVDNGIITASIGDSSTIQFITLDGNVSAEYNNATTGSYIPNGGDVYCRVKVIRDSDSAIAWSNPIFVNKG